MDAKYHRTDEQIEQYTLGKLPEAELAVFEDHLMICDSCRERAAIESSFTSSMRQALKDEAPALAAVAARPARVTADWFGWLRKPAYSMALAFVGLLAVLVVLSNNRNALPAVATLQLTATRGDMPAVTRARELDLTLGGTSSEGGPFRIEVVNAQGQNVWGSLADSEGDAVQVKIVARLSTGDYFVRLYSADGPMLHEYGFRVRD